AAEAFGGIEPFDGAANQAARLRLGLLANKPEGMPNPNPDPGANPEPAEKIAEAEMQQMVGDDAPEALSGIEPFAGAANQAAPDPVAIDFSRVRLEPLVGGSGITLLVNLSSRRQQFLGNLRAALGPAGARLPLECEMGRFSWRGIGG